MSAGANTTGICVRLLLSIDRREGTQQALATVELAAQHMHRGVVGIDLSGNPSIGELRTWLPALQLARQKGLKLTLHAGEVRPAGGRGWSPRGGKGYLSMLMGS